MMKCQKMELSSLLSTMGSRIRKMRLKQGMTQEMTQEQLVEALYSKKVTISAYENDRIDIKSSVVIELARILECSVSYLMEEEIIVEDCEKFVRSYLIYISDYKMMRFGRLQWIS